jgi:hypothetical protein
MSNQIGYELAALLDAEDPRTIAEMKADDEWYEGVIVDASAHGDGGWTLGWRDANDDSPGYGHGCGIHPSRNPKGITPEVGQTIRFYGKGLGYSFYGMDIDGREVFWRTPLERVLDRVEWLAKHDRKQRERFAEEAPRRDADYEALSPPLKARIDRFRAESSSFRVDSEAYELFACVEADKIAAYLRPNVDDGEEANALVDEFRALPYERQKAMAGLAEGHSGNTFDGACMMARALLTGQPV